MLDVEGIFVQVFKVGLTKIKLGCSMIGESGRSTIGESGRFTIGESGRSMIGGRINEILGK